MDEKGKYLIFAIIVVVAIGADQATKLWADARLANRLEHPRLVDGPHDFKIDVPATAAGTTLEDFLRADLSGTPDAEVKEIARRYTLVNGDRPTSPTVALAGNETLTVQNRQIEVIPDYFHFRYTRNPGAAFSFLADAGESVRRPFFIIVSLIAVIVIFFILRRTPPDRRLLILALSLIVGGAVGNLIDRFAYGWVIDFIDWHFKRDYTWPTFNIADAAITGGIIMMAIDMLFPGKEVAPEAADKPADPELADATEPAEDAADKAA